MKTITVELSEYSPVEAFNQAREAALELPDLEGWWLKIDLTGVSLIFSRPPENKKTWRFEFTVAPN